MNFKSKRIKANAFGVNDEQVNCWFNHKQDIIYICGGECSKIKIK